MKTVIVKKTSLPEFLPHGWKTQVAKILGIHPNTGYSYQTSPLVPIQIDPL